MTYYAAPGFLPLLRPGDLLFTALALQHRMSGGKSKCRSVSAIRGNGKKLGLCRFGQDALESSKRIFGEAVLPRELAERHSLFGLYSRFLTPINADAWFSALTGRPREGAFSPWVIDNPLDVLHGARTPLRSCGRCIQADIESRGFPAWRVLHQINWIHHCLEHGALLLDDLAPKKKGIWPLQLPGSSVRSVPVRSPIPISDGYMTYLKLWPMIFSGKMTIVECSRWNRLIAKLTAKYGSPSRARDEIKHQIERSWRIPYDNIARVLGIEGRWGFVDSLPPPYNINPAQRIAHRVVILSAFRQFARDGDISITPSNELSDEVEL